MPFFHITYDDGRMKNVIALRRRNPVPVAGQKLVVAKPFYTPAGFVYRRGDVLELVEQTQDAPFHVSCSLGNWVVKCPHQTSVWSNIQWAIEEKVLEVA